MGVKLLLSVFDLGGTGGEGIDTVGPEFELEGELETILLIPILFMFPLTPPETSFFPFSSLQLTARSLRAVAIPHRVRLRGGIGGGIDVDVELAVVDDVVE